MADNVINPEVVTPATPEIVTPAAPIEAPETGHLDHLSKVFNRTFTDADLNNILQWAEAKGNPALDEILVAVDSSDATVANKALETMYNIYQLAASKTPTGSTLSSRIKKATLNATTHQPATPVTPAAATMEEVTANIVASASKTGRIPSPAEVLAAHGIKL